MSEVENQEVENTEIDDVTEVIEQPEETETPAEGEESGDEPSPGADEEGGEEEEGAEGDEGEGDEEGGEPAHKPNVKFKAGVYNKDSKVLEQKEFEIDKRFHGLMDTPENEKLVRELHEKAYGLDSVKERYAESRAENQTLVQENMDIKGSIDEMRSIYQGAVKSGNLHKLDKFFDRLNIPQDVVLSYALAKVQLNEMDPAQRNALLGQLQAEDRAEEAARQRMSTDQQYAAQAQQIKTLQTEQVLASPDVSALASAFDERVGKPGAFKQAVFQAGQLAWLQSKGTVDLTPQQAVKAVIDQYGLTTGNPLVPTAQQPGAQVQPGGQKPGAPKKPIAPIPNIQGRTASPLKQKPRSVEDLKKIYNEQYSGRG